jgi:O-antigen/teichoic acid export membrane protein
LELPRDVTALAALYSSSLVFNVTGTSIAVLRMANRYTAFAVQATAAAAIRLIAVAIAFALNGGLAAFAIAWLASDILGYLLLSFLGFRVARLHGLLNVHPMGFRKVLHTYPGLVRFLIVANVQSSVRLGTTQLDTLIVGSTLGAPAAGSYTVVKKLSKLISIVLSPLYYVVYPELTLATSGNDRVTFNALVNKSAIVMAGLCALGWIAFLVFGRWFIDITVGSHYTEVYQPLLIYLVGVSLSLITFSYQPAMLALGRAESAFKILLTASVAYMAALPTLAHYSGLLGACASYVLYCAIWGALMHHNIRGAMSTWATA